MLNFLRKHLPIIGYAILAVAVAVALAFYFNSAEREQRVEELRRVDQALCAKTHQTIELFHLYLREGSRQFELRPTTPENIEYLRQFKQRVLEMLERADCKVKNLDDVRARAVPDNER